MSRNSKRKQPSPKPTELSELPHVGVLVTRPSASFICKYGDAPYGTVWTPIVGQQLELIKM
jgi:hypothetical protein